MDILFTVTVLAVIIAGVFVFAPRPTLNPSVPSSRVPVGLTPAELAAWLNLDEAAQDGVIEGAEAIIEWADEPAATDLCVLYIHGFSATRQETAPVTARIAADLGANVVHARLAGHGLSVNPMAASAEDWLQSVTDAWHLAASIGQRVIIIATSTGAPLSLWLSQYVADRHRIHSFIFLAPNIRIRTKADFLLTWPWANHWVPLLLGREHSWEPENEMAGRYWTSRYSTNAIIEMQKVVDWLKRTPIETGGIPLATLYMEGDPTISHEAAIRFHEDWDSPVKRLIRVEIDADNPQHVFAGDITAPQRTDWCVGVCGEFLRSVPVDRMSS